MYTKEALDKIDHELRRLGLRGQLIRKLRVDRPRLTWDTLARAFSEPETQTPLLKWIRDEAQVMVKVAEMNEVLDAA